MKEQCTSRNTNCESDMKTIPSTPHHQGVPSIQHLKIFGSIWFKNFTSGAIIFHTQNYLLRSNVSTI
jgi:hypothetical protein